MANVIFTFIIKSLGIICYIYTFLYGNSRLKPWCVKHFFLYFLYGKFLLILLFQTKRGLMHSMSKNEKEQLARITILPLATGKNLQPLSIEDKVVWLENRQHELEGLLSDYLLDTSLLWRIRESKEKNTTL